MLIADDEWNFVGCRSTPFKDGLWGKTSFCDQSIDVDGGGITSTNLRKPLETSAPTRTDAGAPEEAMARGEWIWLWTAKAREAQGR